MTLPEVFHFDDGKESFEDFGQVNGETFWWQSDLCRLLGYQSANSFRNAVGKAMTACNAIGADVGDNFRACRRQFPDGSEVSDCKLSRFACYLIAMNADSKKPAVAKAMAYFAAIAEAAENYMAQVQAVERVTLREEMSDRERSLSGVAHSAGVQQYALFQNAGYLGMYNMHLRRLKAYKGVDERRSLLDFMGREELAANLFRITQTEAKIRNENIVGQGRLENAAMTVGQKVRRTMKEISGTTPESLPIAEDVKQVHRRLKATNKQFKKIDKKRLPRAGSQDD